MTDLYSERVILNIPNLEVLKSVAQKNNITENEIIQWFIKTIEETALIYSNIVYATLSPQRLNFLNNIFKEYIPTLYNTIQYYFKDMDVNSICNFVFVPYTAILVQYKKGISC